MGSICNISTVMNLGGMFASIVDKLCHKVASKALGLNLHCAMQPSLVYIQDWACLSHLSVENYVGMRVLILCLVGFVLHLLLTRLTFSNLCCTSKFIIKHQQNLNWNTDVAWISFGGWKCMFVDSLTKYIDFLLVVFIIWMWNSQRNLKT